MHNSLFGRPCNLTGFKKIKVKYRNKKTPKQLLELHNSRQYSPRIKSSSLMQFIKSNYDMKYRPKNCVTIKIGSSRLDYLQKIYDNKKKNYSSIMPCFQRSFLESTCHGRYSSRCNYNRYSYRPMIQSFGYIVNKNTMYFKTDTDDGIISRVIKSPKGFHFAIDQLGIKIQSNSIKSMEYHFTALDLLPYAIKKNDYKSGQLMVAIAKNNYQLRKKTDLKSDIFSDDVSKVNKVLNYAHKLGVKISIVDSIKAGNCLAGTESWMQKNKLEHKHYPVFIISSRMNNDRRVKIAILQAIERTKIESARGYSMLNDHYLNYSCN